MTQQVEDNVSIQQKGLSVLKNGGTFWLFSIIILIVMGIYVHFFIATQDNFLANQKLSFGSFFDVKMNYVVMFGLLWLILFFFAVFN